MASTADQTITDFDLNFLDAIIDTAVPVSKSEKQRKQIQNIKKRIVTISSFHEKYKEKCNSLQAQEQQTLNITEECKQLSIQYKDALDENSRLQSELTILQNENRNIQATILETQNQYGALKSHCNQLQSLAKENETQIQSLLLEKNLEKSEAKENAKKVTTLQKEKGELVKLIITLGEVVLGARKANKNDRVLLAKYKIPLAKTIIPEDEASRDDEVFDEVSTSPSYDAEDQILSPAMQLICQNGKATPLEVDRDSDSGTEIFSKDSGRGSSLAYSGSEKCFNSPEYFTTESSIKLLIDKQIEKPACVDVATSPIWKSTSHQRSTPTSPIQCLTNKTRHDASKTPPAPNVDVGTSPIIHRMSHKSTSPTVFTNQIQSIFDEPEPPKSTSCLLLTDKQIEKTACVDVATSPIRKSASQHRSTSTSPTQSITNKTVYDASKTQPHPNVDVGTSPIIHRMSHKSSSPTVFANQTNHTKSIFDEPEPPKSLCSTPRKRHEIVSSPIVPVITVDSVSDVPVNDCLPILSCDESDDDDELQVIFTDMRLSHSVVTPIPTMTPIPTTPKSTRVTAASSVSSTANTQNERSHSLCPEAAKIREELANLEIGLNSKFSNLTKEFRDIKSLLIEFTTRSTANVQKAVQFNDDSIALGQFNKQKTLVPEENTDVVQLPKKNTEFELAKTKETPAHQSSSGIQEDRLMENEDIETIVIIEENDQSNSAMALATEADHSNIAPCLSYSPTSNKVKDKCGNTYAETNNIFKKPADSAIKIKNKAGDPIRRMSQAIAFEEEIVKCDTAAEDISEQNREELQISRATDNIVPSALSPATKPRKLTKLERMRKKLLPKSKIKPAEVPSKKLLKKRVALEKLKDTASTEYNKEAAYDKAVKIMAEIRKIPKKKTIVTNINRKIINNKKPVNSEDDKVEANNNSKIMATGESKETLTAKGSGADQYKQLRTSEINVSRSEGTIKSTNNKSIHINLTKETLSDSPKELTYNLENFEDFVQGKLNTLVVQGDTENLAINSETSTFTRKDPKNTAMKQFKNDTSNESLSKRTRSPIVTRTRSAKSMDTANCEEKININDTTIKNSPLTRENRKRSLVDNNEQSKRVLRSSVGSLSFDDPFSVKIDKDIRIDEMALKNQKIIKSLDSELCKEKLCFPDRTEDSIKTYSDIDMFSDANADAVDIAETQKKKPKVTDNRNIENPHESILCAMLDKYCFAKLRKNPPQVPSDKVTTQIKQKIEDTIAQIVELPYGDVKAAMNKFVEDIKAYPIKDFTCGFLKYLADPTRKSEMLKKRFVMNSPAMTKPEQVLLYVVDQLKNAWPNVYYITYILDNIEFMLFRLNKTPEFDTIESVAHFYAVLCRYIGAKSRLRLFMMDAMYCLQYKAVPLIRQSLDVWMHVLPLSHLGIAKSPLVTCLVYLLHFYKCEDRFNRVQDIRNILKRSYAYEITEWNEQKLLETIRNAITELRAVPIEKKMLRLALIILAKRQGPRWCQKNIINGILLPMIDQENVRDKSKVFSLSMLGPLMKPYPLDMTVNVEVIINQLLDRLDRNVSADMEEAIFTSLIYMSKHSYTRVLQSLLKWRPKQLSPDMESLLRDFVQTKPIKAWKIILSKIPLTPF